MLAYKQKMAAVCLFGGKLSVKKLLLTPFLALKKYSNDWKTLEGGLFVFVKLLSPVFSISAFIVDVCKTQQSDRNYSKICVV